VFNDEFVEW